VVARPPWDHRRGARNKPQDGDRGGASCWSRAGQDHRLCSGVVGHLALAEFALLVGIKLKDVPPDIGILHDRLALPVGLVRRPIDGPLPPQVNIAACWQA
jgi:hypothetical protein